MAYRLSEVIAPDFTTRCTVVNNTVTTKNYYIKLKGVNVTENRKIIFEVTTTRVTDVPIIGFSNCDKYDAKGVYALGCFAWRHPYPDNKYMRYIYTNGTYYGWYTNGYNTYPEGSDITFFGASCNNTDYYHHIILEPHIQRFTIYNPIKKSISHQGNLSKTQFIDTICFLVYAVDPFTINPDVDSFKYQPFVSHDSDLYSSVLNLPYTPVYFPESSTNNKNILSIL